MQLLHTNTVLQEKHMSLEFCHQECSVFTGVDGRLGQKAQDAGNWCLRLLSESETIEINSR